MKSEQIRWALTSFKQKTFGRDEKEAVLYGECLSDHLDDGKKPGNSTMNRITGCTFRPLVLFSIFLTWQSLPTMTATFVEGREMLKSSSQSHHEVPHQEPKRQNHTNVIILLADNLAYDDVGVFQGAHAHEKTKRRSRTPNLDRAAMEGRRLLNWNSPAVLCSASRAALLTGEYQILGHDRRSEDHLALSRTSRNALTSDFDLCLWS